MHVCLNILKWFFCGRYTVSSNIKKSTKLSILSQVNKSCNLKRVTQHCRQGKHRDDPGLSHFGPAVRWWLNVDWVGAGNIFSVCEFLGEWDPVASSSSSRWPQSDIKINVKSKSKNEELIISGAFTLIEKDIQTKATVTSTPHLKHKFHIVLEADDKI